MGSNGLGLMFSPKQTAYSMTGIMVSLNDVAEEYERQDNKKSFAELTRNTHPSESSHICPKSLGFVEIILDSELSLGCWC